MAAPTIAPTGLRKSDRYTVLPNGCWQFGGSSFPDSGYGQIKRGGRNRRAHRYFYEALVGPIPEGMTLDHTCHNDDPTCRGGVTCPHRRCVNPAHLEPVPHEINNGRSPHSLSAINARKTHCIHGHEFTPENTYIQPATGKRQCRVCIRFRYERRRANASQGR